MWKPTRYIINPMDVKVIFYSLLLLKYKTLGYESYDVYKWDVSDIKL